jgi:hypothetical protein
MNWVSVSSKEHLASGPTPNFVEVFCSQVALLFLTMGEMRHEALWSMWLKQAAGKVPTDCLAAASCGHPDSQQLITAHKSCLASKPGENAAVMAVPTTGKDWEGWRKKVNKSIRSKFLIAGVMVWEGRGRSRYAEIIKAMIRRRYPLIQERGRKNCSGQR